MTGIQTHRSQIGLFNFKTFTFKNKKYKQKNSKVPLYTFLFIFFLLLGAQNVINFSKVTQSKVNISQHIDNGNILAKGNLNFFLQNKGNSNFYNKVDDINFIIQQFSHDLFSICEANHNITSSLHFKGYRIESNRLHTHNNIARSVVLICDNFFISMKI